MARKYLVYGLNWLGDSVMSMPSLQMLKQTEPDCHVTVLARSSLAPLWQMHGAVDEVMERPERLADAVRAVRAGHFEKAFIFPNSFRSALIPFLARVPQRIGVRGQWRAWMLTRPVDDRPVFGGHHQAWEYVAILGLQHRCRDLDPPNLRIPKSAKDSAPVLLGNVETEQGWIGLIPGAARGPSKQWPADAFAQVGRKLTSQTRCRAMILGTRKEAAACAHVAAGIGSMAVNLAGETSLPEMAALLSECRVVICNDSGGMHLAAAVHTPVVAVYGLTDATKTGPLGPGHKIVTASSAPGSRDIPRRSREAARALALVRPDDVCEAAMEILGHEGE